MSPIGNPFPQAGAFRWQDGSDNLGEVLPLLLAGHETTATALAWALYWIHHLPKVREKLLQELDALGDTPDLNSILRLPRNLAHLPGGDVGIKSSG